MLSRVSWATANASAMSQDQQNEAETTRRGTHEWVLQVQDLQSWCHSRRAPGSRPLVDMPLLHIMFTCLTKCPAIILHITSLSPCFFF